jgi:hypothetical protein
MSNTTTDGVPFKVETWPLDADGFEAKLCTECGTPVRYGSRHSSCGRKVMGLATPAPESAPASLEETPMPELPPLPAVAWMMKSGHGTGFKEVLPLKYQLLEFGGRPIWSPLCDHATASALIQSLRERAESAEKDAARYRWLRQFPNNISMAVYSETSDLSVGGLLRRDTYLDAAIDAAMEKP